MKALLCTPFCTTNSERNNTESPGGGITRRYNADVFGFDGQGLAPEDCRIRRAQR
jgi:hypothetical protein